MASIDFDLGSAIVRLSAVVPRVPHWRFGPATASQPADRVPHPSPPQTRKGITAMSFALTDRRACKYMAASIAATEREAPKAAAKRPAARPVRTPISE